MQTQLTGDAELNSVEVVNSQQDNNRSETKLSLMKYIYCNMQMQLRCKVSKAKWPDSAIYCSAIHNIVYRSKR